MAIDLVKSREEVLSPSAPCIVKNLAQVEGGCRIYVNHCNADYPYSDVYKGDHGEYYPKVLKAGHLIEIDTDPECRYNSFTEAVGAFESSDECFSESQVGVGVLTHDAIVYKEGDGDNVRYYAYGSVMVAGVVDASKLPFELLYSIADGDKAFDRTCIFFQNLSN